MQVLLGNIWISTESVDVAVEGTVCSCLYWMHGLFRNIHLLLGYRYDDIVSLKMGSGYKYLLLSTFHSN